MAILDIFRPGRVKTRLSSDLADLTQLALSHPGVTDLPETRRALWKAICLGASDLVTQLFVDNRDKRLDWGLKRHKRRLDQPRMTAIFWWMLLYQLVILRNRGLDGLDKEEEFNSLCLVAYDFMDTLASSPGNTTANPGPWDQQWERQVSLEAALGLYNRVMQVLGLRVDLEARISRVSLFTSASESAYEVNIQGPIRKRSGAA